LDAEACRWVRIMCKTKLEKAWLLTSVTAFVLHRLLEIEPNRDFLWLIEVAMIALSFPFGPIAMLFILMGVEGVSDYADVSWLLDWSTLIFVGYIQWFWVLPEIRRNNRLITLNLTSPVESGTPVSPDDSITPPALPPLPVVFNVATFVPTLAEFDAEGLTALDRVLRAEVSSPPALKETPPSRVETIFPAAV
jgi:hypothetical protein